MDAVVALVGHGIMLAASAQGKPLQVSILVVIVLRLKQQFSRCCRNPRSLAVAIAVQAALDIPFRGSTFSL